MKNKVVKTLSILLSMCMLGSSGVDAAEFSSGMENVTELPEQEATTEVSEVADGFESSEELPEAADDADVFSAQEDAVPFSDSETSDEFSAEEETEEIPGAEDPESIDSTLAARYKNSIVEAQLEADPSVKTNCKFYNISNLEGQDYPTFGLRVSSYLTTSPDGRIMRVQFGAIEGKALVEYYDTSYNIQSTVTVPLALPEFGAFYESGNSYYILTGQSNPDKNDSAEVYRVTKYSKDWKVQGSASLYGEHTQYPFGFGSARMTMDGSYLYVRTCHVMYNNHQANLSFSVNTDSMSIVDKLTDVRFWQEGYASHSFNQFVQIDQGKMVTLDQCDAYPSRALVLYKYNTDLSGGKFAPKYNSWEPSKPDPTYCTKTDILKVNGMSGDNYTGTSAGALEYSDSNWLAAGNFDTDGSGSSRNVFVAAVPKDGGSPVVRYFSNYAGTNDSAATPHLVKTGSNSFVLLWSSKGKVYYTAIDGSGQQTGKTYSMDGNLSDCVPSVINGKLIWYTVRRNVNVFYEINLSDLSGAKAVKIVNGHKYSYGKEVTNGTVTRTCTVCGESQGTAAVPVSLDPTLNSGANYSYIRENVTVDPGSTYRINCNPAFKASENRLDECEVISSDPSVVSVNMVNNTSADITVHKSGTATLTIRSKYNPDVSYTTNISAGILNSNQYQISLSASSFVYDGTEHKPTVTLYKKGKAVDEKNYTVTYKGDLVNAGTVQAVVTAKGEITGTMTKDFKITPADFSKCNVSIAKGTVYLSNEKACIPEFTVKDGDKILTEGKDFSVSYLNNDRPGTAMATFKGLGNYAGNITKTFTIVKKTEQAKDIGKCSISLSKTAFEADGTEKKPAVTVKDGNTVLKEGTDYSVSYSDNIKAGTATVTVKGKGKYSGTVMEKFEITEAVKGSDISDARIILSKIYYEYDGKEHKPEVSKLYIKGKEVDSKNYTVTYSDDLVNAGSPKVTVTGKGSFTGTCSTTYTIAPRTFENCTVIVPEGPFYYYEGSVYEADYIVKDGDKTLVKGKDYTVDYKYNNKPGHTWDTLRGMGNYRNDAIQKQIYIIGPSFDQSVVTLENDTVIYDGHPAEPKVVMTFGEKKLKLNQDYTVKYDLNDEPGTAVAYVNGLGEYVGFKMLFFTIKEEGVKNIDISKAKVSVSGDAVRNGKKVNMPEVNLELNGKRLNPDKDFYVNCLSTLKGETGTMIITGKGIYTGVIQQTIRILPEKTKDDTNKNDTENKNDIGNKSDTEDKNSTENKGDDEARKDNVENKDDVGNKGDSEEKDNTDKKDDTDKKDNTDKKDDNTLPDTNVTITTVKPRNTAKVTLKSSGKGKVKISWKPVKSVSGYQIQYSSSANMKKSKSVNAKSSAKNITVKKLSSKKKCYIRIRTYKTIKGKKYYSDWSKVKTVKVR